MECNRIGTQKKIHLFLTAMLASAYCAADQQGGYDLRPRSWIKEVVKDPITDLYGGRIYREGAFVGGGHGYNPIILFAFSDVDLSNSSSDILPILAGLPKPKMSILLSGVDVTVRWDGEKPISAPWEFNEYNNGLYYAVPYNPYQFKRRMLEHDAFFIRYKSEQGRNITLHFSTGNLSEVLDEYSLSDRLDD